MSARKSAPSRSPGTKTRRGGCLSWTLLLGLLLVPAALAGWGWLQLQRPYRGYSEPAKSLVVAPGAAVTTILNQLESEQVIANAGLARVYLLYVLRNPPLQAGEYRFEGPLTTDQVLQKLVRGQVVTTAVTLIEGLTLDETADQLAKAGLGRRDTFLALLRSPERIADLDPAADSLEGYLFPETYRFSHSTSESEIVATLIKTFRTRFEEKVRGQLGNRRLRELVTLASIVEKEAQLDAERPLIAAVYRNRLDQHIGLAADPTVIYALKRLGRWNGNLRRDDLRLDSPYNTYRYAGLPPGPICSPGLASLEAAADPAHVPYIYFVSRNDGSHVFAETLSEHNRNVERWQRQYFRDKRARERAGR